MKKTIIVASSLLVLFLVIGGVAMVSAGPPWQGGCGWGPGGPPMGRHMGFHGEDAADFIMWRMDRMADELNLTSEQQDKFDLWKSEAASHLSNAMEERKQFMTQCMTELEKPEPNIPMLVDAIKGKVDHMSQFANQQLDGFADLWQSLDKTQQETILDHVRQRMAQHKR